MYIKNQTEELRKMANQQNEYVFASPSIEEIRTIHTLYGDW